VITSAWTEPNNRPTDTDQRDSAVDDTAGRATAENVHVRAEERTPVAGEPMKTPCLPTATAGCPQSAVLGHPISPLAIPLPTRSAAQQAGPYRAPDNRVPRRRSAMRLSNESR
jgi:hypothetical protein